MKKIWLIGSVLSAGAVVAILWRPSPASVPRHVSTTAEVSPVEVSLAELSLRGRLLYLKGDTIPFTGVMIERYPNEVLKSSSSISNGMLHGLSQGWFTNGQIQVTEHFKTNMSHGLRTKFHSNGKKLSEATIVDGKLHGPYRRWHENGVLAEEVQMRQGSPDGLSHSWHSNGHLKALVVLEGGKVVQQQFWTETETVSAADETFSGGSSL